MSRTARHLLVVLLFLPALRSPVTGQDRVHDLDALLEEHRTRHRLPAVGAIVIVGERVVARGTTGFRKLGSPERAGDDDRWHLGSCTKAMTATLAGVLVQQRKLKWTTRIGEAIPALAESMRPEFRDVTLEMLLAHRGGLGGDFKTPEDGWKELWQLRDDPVAARRRMATLWLSHAPQVPVGSFSYSNAGYGIAGHMLETVMEKPWEALMRELVFEPLGMDSAGFGVPGTPETVGQPWPHGPKGAPVPPGPLADNPPAIGPAGVVHASLRDWARFLSAHLEGARGRRGKLGGARLFEPLHAGRKTDDSGGLYALGWAVARRPWARGRRRGDVGLCLTHNGSNNSWYASTWLAPERDVGLAVTTNIGGDPRIARAVDAIVSDLVKRIVGGPRSRR